jgi:hypothetical protein
MVSYILIFTCLDAPEASIRSVDLDKLLAASADPKAGSSAANC